MTKDNFDLLIEILGDAGINTTGVVPFINEIHTIHLAINEEIGRT
jgi:hypothetical protein